MVVAVFIGVYRLPGSVLSAFHQVTRFVLRAALWVLSALVTTRLTEEEAEAQNGPLALPRVAPVIKGPAGI